jgi:hypothetical protein
LSLFSIRLFNKEEAMKKFTFALMLAAVMLFSVAPLHAEGMLFGVKGGLNMASFIGDDAEGTSMKMGGVGGAFLCYNINEIFAIQPEILFSMKGASFDTLSTSVSWSLNYIEIPFLFKVNLPTEGKMKPSLYAGPALGILMSAKYEDLDIKDDIKSTDIGILAGAAIGYQMENGSLLSLELRYEVGMTSFDKAVAPATEADIMNSAISVMVGYGFAF